MKITGFTHKETGVHFNNRKEAVIIMGYERYCKFLKQGEFIWDETEK